MRTFRPQDEIELGVFRLSTFVDPVQTNVVGNRGERSKGSPRFLLGHLFRGGGPFNAQWIDKWLARLRGHGVDAHSLSMGLDIPGYRLPWTELDARWRRGDRRLLQLYERVARAIEDFDVLINFGGVNLHPDFLAALPCMSVLGFFDDPESSALFSRPVAAAHDICMVGNVASLGDYRAWGARMVRWWPNGFRADDFDPGLTEEAIRTRARDVDVALLCERVTHWRRKSVDAFALAFPQGVYRGPGWPQGFLPEPQRVPLLQRTRIGINIHNSTGPINFRTFYLPANGVLQICDNRSHLGKVFELGREVVGYDRITEAIELCRYYLAHEEERVEIAVAGWRRALRDYNEVAAFQHVIRAVEELRASRASRPPDNLSAFLGQQALRTRRGRWVYRLTLPVRWPAAQLRRLALGLGRRLAWAIATWRYQRRAGASRPESP
jgi:hypothetical protein